MIQNKHCDYAVKVVVALENVKSQEENRNARADDERVPTVNNNHGECVFVY